MSDEGFQQEHGWPKSEDDQCQWQRGINLEATRIAATKTAQEALTESSVQINPVLSRSLFLPVVMSSR